MAEHIEIDGSEYCLLDSGIAARITMQTQTELIVLTDEVVRATWMLGGQWDGGRNPWYTPTPNPIEIELRTADPRWNPFAINFYQPQPLRTILSIWLAELDTFPAVGWYVDRRAVGVVLDWHVIPAPSNVPTTVLLSGIDHMTSMADATLAERAEESPYDRLLHIATRTKGIYPSLLPSALAGPPIGRYHPSQGMTALDHAVDVATAAEAALVFFPYQDPTDPTIHTMMTHVPMSGLGAPTATWLASTNPAAGAVSPGPDPAYPVLGDSTLVACIDAIQIGRTDAGFRTRIEGARDVAYYQHALVPVDGGPNTAGTYQWQAPFTRWEIGDRWTLTYEAGVAWTGATAPFLRAYGWNGTAAIYADDRAFTVAGSRWTMNHLVEAVVAHDLGTMGMYMFVPGGGTATISGGGTVRVERAGGAGPAGAYVAVGGDEATNGIRALTGYRSPIATQPAFLNWMQVALGWVPNPNKLYPSLLRSSSSSAHPSPGARQWALHLLPGHRLALALDTVTYPPPFLPQLTPWVVAIAFTLEPDSITLDLTCAPPTMNN